ncbi:MAG: transporter substrate-binding domain-containing protein [Clostridia bacterium]|nr:transporter substrate-binding domain-containing protein [Clostridia bacterium]
MRNRIIFICFLVGSVLTMFLYQQSQEKYDKGYLDYFGTKKELTEEEKDWLSNQDKLVFGANIYFAPLSYKENGVYKGFFIDYIQILSEELKKDIEIVDLKNNEAEEKLTNQEIDFCIMHYTQKNEAFAEFTLPIILGKGALCTKADMNILSIKDVKNKKILMTAAVKDFIKTSENKTVIADNLELGVNKLIKGEADVLIGEETVVVYYLKEKEKYDAYRFAPTTVYKKNYIIGVYEDNELLKSILNKTVQNIALKGTIKDLQLKWFGLYSSLSHENISDRIAIIMLIIFTAMASVFYFFYESNKSLYSELEQRMEQLTNSKNDLQTTFDGVTYQMVEINKELEIININKALSKQLNMSKNSIIGSKLQKVLKADQDTQAALENTIHSTFQSGKEQKVEISFDRKIYEASTFPLHDAKDRIYKLLLMMNDVSRSRATERQMIQDNKMIAIGQLAAGVAHEIRNPLGLIRNYCYILKNGGIENEEVRSKALEVIERSVEKSGGIINNLLNFSRISSDKWEEIYLFQFINDLIVFEKNLLKENKVEIELECDNKKLMIYTNTESLEIIIVNLISNSVDAMTKGGKVSISCYLDHDKIHIQISDEGEGIPKEIIDNIFNPFFTTKNNGKGTGLGLYIVYNEVQKLGGEIQVDSKVHEGTVFTIRLPYERGE